MDANVAAPDLHGRMDELPLAYFDVETTGLNPAYGDRIIEVAVVRCEFEETVDSLQQLIDPQRPVSPGAYAVNHISDEMLRGAPPFGQVAERLLAILEGAVVVGHNVSFDLGFLAAELARSGVASPPLVALDTCRLARRNYRFPSHSLGRVASYLRVPRAHGAHRAMADVETTRAVFERMLFDLWRRGARTLEDMLRAQGGPAGSRHIPVAPVPAPIQQALDRHCLLRLTYEAGTNARTERVVRPLKLLTWSGNLTLVAHCTLRNALRHFRIDRIVAMELVDDVGDEDIDDDQ
jgi:DNA polymerase-3 subunit epsilon